MVQALLDDRKTMTRRTKGLEPINECPDDYKFAFVEQNQEEFYFGYYFFEYSNGKYPPKTYHPIECPYQVGDVLWVRETFYKTEAKELNGAFFYKADIDKLGWTFKWKPSLFMPKEYARIFLRIKSIKVERLQDISEKDAIAEGVEYFYSDLQNALRYKKYTKTDSNNNWKYSGEFEYLKASSSFESLWESINGRTSWDSNPYVFVYEFERIEKPLEFIL